MKKINFFAFLLFWLSSFAYASQWYNITFKNPNPYYSITIDPPIDHSCMHNWNAPDTAVTLQPDQTTEVQIEDSNNVLALCTNRAKTVTWQVHANPLPGEENYFRAKTCAVELNVSPDPTWTTTVKSSCTSGKDILVADASCNGQSCLNSEVSGVPDYGAIDITFFTTERTSCRDRTAHRAYIDNRVMGIYPAWDGKDKIVVDLALSSQEVMSGHLDYEHGLDTENGKRFFKYATLSYITSSRLQAYCDGNGALGEINLLH